MSNNKEIDPDVLNILKDLNMADFSFDEEGNIKFVIKCVNKSPFNTPSLATAGSSGFDLQVDFTNDDGDDVIVHADGQRSVELKAGKHRLFKTGLYFGMVKGMELQLRPRSGMSNKRGLIIPNSPATIDSDYTGEILVGLYNLGFAGDQVITQGDRICQAVFASVITDIDFKLVNDLNKTERGSGGFGSTGK